MDWTCAQNGQKVRIPKRVIFGELNEGRRGRGRPKKNSMTFLEEDWSKKWPFRGAPNPLFTSWVTIAKNRPE